MNPTQKELNKFQDSIIDIETFFIFMNKIKYSEMNLYIKLREKFIIQLLKGNGIFKFKELELREPDTTKLYNWFLYYGCLEGIKIEFNY